MARPITTRRTIANYSSTPPPPFWSRLPFRHTKPRQRIDQNLDIKSAQTSHTFGIAALWKTPVDVTSRVGAIPCRNLADAVRDAVVNNTGHPVVRNNNNDHHYRPTTTASVVVDVFVVDVVVDDNRDYTTANNPIDRAVGWVDPARPAGSGLNAKCPQTRPTSTGQWLLRDWTRQSRHSNRPGLPTYHNGTK